MNASLEYLAACHATRIRALGAWVRDSLPVVFFDAPTDDYEFGCNIDAWAHRAGCVIQRTTSAPMHGHYKLAKRHGKYGYTILSQFRWQFTIPK